MRVATRAIPRMQMVLMRLCSLSEALGLKQVTMKSFARTVAPAMHIPAMEDWMAAKIPQKMMPPTQEGRRVVAVKIVA